MKSSIVNFDLDTTTVIGTSMKILRPDMNHHVAVLQLQVRTGRRDPTAMRKAAA